MKPELEIFKQKQNREIGRRILRHAYWYLRLMYGIEAVYGKFPVSDLNHSLGLIWNIMVDI
jgi:hypothetical protein